VKKRKELSSWLGTVIVTRHHCLILSSISMTRTLILEDKTDRFVNHSGQLILDTAVCMAEKHKNLPIEDATKFALAFEEFSERLATQDEKLKGKEIVPARFPDPQLQPTLKHLPSKKRAFIRRKAAEQQERDESRARRKAERLAELRAIGDNAIEEADFLRS
jgi:hypothetical protein